MSTTTLHGFQSVVHTLRGLLDDIEREVTAAIDVRDPYAVSSAPEPRPSGALLESYKGFTRFADKLALYAAEPSDFGATLIGGFHESNAALAVAELRVADTLADQEVPLKELAHKVNADETRLRQVLRILVNRQLFRETYYGSDVFANNRLSSIFLSAHKKNLLSIAGHWADDSYRAGCHIVDAVRADNNKKCPFEFAHGETIWEFFKKPESAIARSRTNEAMVSADGFLHGALIYDYDWTKHGEDATIVDVGGGVGGASIEIARKFPKIKVILQDKPSVIETAPKFWEDNAPECKPRITFTPHDFFGPQVKEKIFFMRFILHDWVDEDCLRILKPIRDVIPSADEGGRLYIADCILDERSERLKYMMDMQMLTLTGAMERTDVEMTNLLGRAGFRVIDFHNNRGFCCLIEAVAA